jgi:hypothetical protein
MMLIRSCSREPNYETDSLVPHLILEAGEDRGIDPDFLAEAVCRFEDDDSAKTMLTKAVAGLSAQLSQLTMNDVYQLHVNVSYYVVLPQMPTNRVLGAQTYVSVSPVSDGYCRDAPISDGCLSRRH